MAQGFLQTWDAYAPEHHDTWRRLYERQVDTLSEKASPVYLESLGAMSESLTSESVPRIEAMEAQLLEATGWS